MKTAAGCSASEEESEAFAPCALDDVGALCATNVLADLAGWSRPAIAPKTSSSDLGEMVEDASNLSGRLC